MSDSVDDEEVKPTKVQEPPPPRRRPKKLVFPRREPSLIIPERKVIYITPDKTTCVECVCYPKEDPYVKHKKMNPCQFTPPTLLALTAAMVNAIPYPEAFDWSDEEVADWMEYEVGFPQYRECILDNHINGRRLLLLEDPSHLPQINIRYFDHIQVITAKIHQLFTTEFIRFARSVGLPPRKPLTHCTGFKSRTGPTWGIRDNWDRCDILRWMKILDPAPVYRDHWELVWYLKTDFPDTKFARLPPLEVHEYIPHYVTEKEPCLEYMVPRKFKILKDIDDEEQMIWMEHRQWSIDKLIADKKEAEEKRIKKLTIPKKTRLEQKKIRVRGLKGKDMLLARRKMAKPKFLP